MDGASLPKEIYEGTHVPVGSSLTTTTTKLTFLFNHNGSGERERDVAATAAETEERGDPRLMASIWRALMVVGGSVVGGGANFNGYYFIVVTNMILVASCTLHLNPAHTATSACVILCNTTTKKCHTLIQQPTTVLDGGRPPLRIGV